MALTPTSPFRPRRWKGALIDINSDVEIEVLDPEYRKVNATADSHEIKNAKSIIISNDTSIKLRIMFDLNYNLEERIIREQFMS
jgi:NAD+ kinase